MDKEIIMGIRPESVHDEEMYLSNASTGIIECDVDITEMMGAETFLYLTCQGIPLTARVSPRSKARPQDKIKVALDHNRVISLIRILKLRSLTDYNYNILSGTGFINRSYFFKI